jgi:hypothetical protein
MSPYKVMVDDNFHYMEEDERWEYGTFATAEEALDACRRLVDEAMIRSLWRSTTQRKSIFQPRPMPSSARQSSPCPARWAWSAAGPCSTAKTGRISADDCQRAHFVKNHRLSSGTGSKL